MSCPTEQLAHLDLSRSAEVEVVLKAVEDLAFTHCSGLVGIASVDAKGLTTAAFNAMNMVSNCAWVHQGIHAS